MAPGAAAAVEEQVVEVPLLQGLVGALGGLALGVQGREQAVGREQAEEVGDILERQGQQLGRATGRVGLRQGAEQRRRARGEADPHVRQGRLEDQGLLEAPEEGETREDQRLVGVDRLRRRAGLEADRLECEQGLAAAAQGVAQQAPVLPLAEPVVEDREVAAVGLHQLGELVGAGAHAAQPGEGGQQTRVRRPQGLHVVGRAQPALTGLVLDLHVLAEGQREPVHERLCRGARRRECLRHRLNRRHAALSFQARSRSDRVAAGSWSRRKVWATAPTPLIALRLWRSAAKLSGNQVAWVSRRCQSARPAASASPR